MNPLCPYVSLLLLPAVEGLGGREECRKGRIEGGRPEGGCCRLFAPHLSGKEGGSGEVLPLPPLQLEFRLTELVRSHNEEERKGREDREGGE